MRLRRVDHLDTGTCEFKFTQKVPAARPGFVQGLITNTYLSAAEYDLLLAALPDDAGPRRGWSVPPLGIDVFDPPLHGLVMADVEFSTDQAALSFPLPRVAIAELTDDVPVHRRHSSSETRRHDLLAWLAEYGIELQQSE